MAQPGQGNPFGASPAAAPSPQQQTSANPFDPFTGQAAPALVQHNDSFSAAATDNNTVFYAPTGVTSQPQYNSFIAAPGRSLPENQGFMPQHQVPMQQPSSYSQQEPTQHPFQEQSPPQPGFAPQPEQPPQQQGFSPQELFVAPLPQQGAFPPISAQPQPPQQQAQYSGYPQVDNMQQQAQNLFSTALVPSHQASNPYAYYAREAPYGGGEAIVPAAQQQSQWGMSGTTASGGAVAASFDPFAPPPPPALAPVPPPQPPVPVTPPPQQQAPSNELVPSAAPQGYYQATDFPFDSFNQVPQEEDKKLPAALDAGPPVLELNSADGDRSVVSETLTRGEDREMVLHESSRPPQNLQNKYSPILAREAGPGCAPLPKGDLVVKSGYILARISFRTILMKKWKQTYWVQYGRHTMLWFRSENHFNEWLSNPYLSQAERNFLVKLAINFVHDLYKPNVRGYQVTQSHTKPYGHKLIRQFKLERWMDYGPTIAAAFGSPDEREVDELRQTLIECMRNTPLENGIRATGAVRPDYSGPERAERRNGNPGEPFSYDDPPRRSQVTEMTSARLDGDAYNRASAWDGGVPSSGTQNTTRASPVASATDLLDDSRGYENASHGTFGAQNAENCNDHNQYHQQPAPHYHQQPPPSQPPAHWTQAPPQQMGYR